MKLCGLVSNFHIHVSVSDLYIVTIGPPIFCSKIFGSVSLQCKDSLSRYREQDEISLSSPRKNPKFSANAPVDGSLKVGGREYCMKRYWTVPLM